MRGDAGNVLRLVVVAVVALCVGWFGPQPHLPHAASNATLPAFPDALSGAARGSDHVRANALQHEIAVLRQQVAALGGAAPAGAPDGPDEDAGEMQAGSACLPSSTSGVVVTGFQRLDAVALSSAGLSEAEQLEVRAIAAAAHAEYERTRDAIEGSARQSALDVRRALTSRLGEHAYDAYLWASNQRNRLRVLRVVPGSVAARSGLEAGDDILGYDGHRVFDYGDLQARDDASPADRMELRWLHRGELRAATVPASDLGFVAVSERVRPQAQ